MYKAIVEAAVPGRLVEARGVTPDGHRLSQHAEKNHPTSCKPRTRRWTHAVLQEQSQVAAVVGLQAVDLRASPDADEASVSSSTGADKDDGGGGSATEGLSAASRDAARTLARRLRACGATSIALFETWGWRDGDTFNQAALPNYEEFQRWISAGYAALAADVRRSLQPRTVPADTADVPAFVAPALVDGVSAVERDGLDIGMIRGGQRAAGGDGSASGAGAQQYKSDTRVAPAGTAFGAVRAAQGDAAFRRLYREDGSHPSLHGTYIAAVVLAATLHGFAPITLTGGVPQGLSTAEARTLRAVAHDLMRARANATA